MDIPLRAFFSYSYRDSETLKPIFLEACEKAGFLPIFADEIPTEGLTIYEKIRNLILSCDLVIIVFTQPILIGQGLFFEMGLSQAIDKPILLFVQKGHVHIPFDVSGFRFIQYETNNELLSALYNSLSSYRSTLERNEYVQIRREEKGIIDILRDSLEKNALVLGKDSDEEGMAKINRIAKVLRRKKYEPVMLKKLPEIKYLSLEGKMIRVGGLCRFVIAEDSRPSGHIDEVRICANCQFITATVRKVGTSSTWMQAHYPTQYNFMNRFCYGNMKDSTTIRDNLCKNMYDSLEQATDKAILWAEKRIEFQEKYFGRVIYSSF